MHKSIIKYVFTLIIVALNHTVLVAVQEPASTKSSPSAEQPLPLSESTPEWWLEAVEKIAYPDKLALQTELMNTRFEAEAALDSVVSQATRDYFGNYLSQRDMNELAGAKDFLRRFAVVDGHRVVLAIQSTATENSDTKGAKPETKYRGFAQLELSEALWQRRLIRDRLVIALGLSGTILSGLATLTVFLHLNHATKGMYSGRLQMAAAIAFVVIILMIFWVSKFVI